MSNARRRSSPLGIGIGAMLIMVAMVFHLSVVTVHSSPPVGIVIAAGPAHAVAPPTMPGGSDLPGGIVGQVCPQDRVTIIMKTRVDESTLWARVQLVDQGAACSNSRIPVGSIVFLDSRLIGQETTNPGAPPAGAAPTTVAPVPAVPQPVPTAPPVPQPAPTTPPQSDAPGTGQPNPTPTLPPPSYNNCQADPYPDAAPDYPIKIISINKHTEVVTLQNVSGDLVDLTGWTMCSIRGNQTHDGIGGTLAPGESKGFPYAGPGNIWNNEEQDDGALYNNRGQLVSYWDD